MINKVLVVDDSELIHNMYRLMLKKYPACEMISARNGKEALEKLEVEENVDLILLDINMPVMNGVRFLETRNKEGKHTDIPVIIISTEGKEEDTLRGLNLGAKAYIVKPFKSVALHNTIESIFKKTTRASG